MVRIWWSPNCGQQIIGTRPRMPSITELRPQWDRNPPTAGWSRTSSCGAQPTMHALSSFSRVPTKSLSFSATESGRHTHKNGSPLLTNPCHTSNSWSRLNASILPKLTCTTDLDAWESSHVTHLLSCFHILMPDEKDGEEFFCEGFQERIRWTNGVNFWEQRGMFRNRCGFHFFKGIEYNGWSWLWSCLRFHVTSMGSLAFQLLDWIFATHDRF